VWHAAMTRIVTTHYHYDDASLLEAGGWNLLWRPGLCGPIATRRQIQSRYRAGILKHSHMSQHRLPEPVSHTLKIQTRDIVRRHRAAPSARLHERMTQDSLRNRHMTQHRPRFRMVSKTLVGKRQRFGSNQCAKAFPVDRLPLSEMLSSMTAR
jgi:hypothetical protein